MEVLYIMINSLGLRLRDLRKQAGLTQEQLAKETSLSVSAIKSYENGWREPNSKAMAALENFFQVSGAYLRGETDERAPAAVWEDAEIIESVRESLPRQLAGLNDLLKECTPQEQKETFDILVELGHILKMKDTSQRAAGMALIQAVFAATTRCIDVCAGAGEDIDPATRPKQARETAMQSYAQALQKAFFIPD